MPNADTFSIPPIAGFVQKYLLKSTVSIDPFARNKRWATHTNDLNPETAAEHHMDAGDFLKLMAQQGVKADLPRARSASATSRSVWRWVWRRPRAPCSTSGCAT